MLRPLGVSISLAAGLLLVARDSHAHALPSQQQVLSLAGDAGQSDSIAWDGQTRSGLLRRFSAGDVDLEEVLDIAVVRLNTFFTPFRPPGTTEC